MNVGVRSTSGILFANFNQDYSCISVSTRTGYKIYNSDPFGKCYGKRDGGIGIVEMLFCTSLVALVGAGEQPAFSPRRLQIINTKRQSTICELTFSNAILAVKLNRKRLVVVLEEHIYIYDIANMKLLHTIDTSPNPNALCSLSPSSENCYLAYPSNASTSSGEVLIFDVIHLQAVTIIQAHKSPLSNITFNYDGTMIATASDKGTVIRVFSVPSGQKLFQFRRGTYAARIYSMSFHLGNGVLAVSSDSDTVHVFRLDEGDRAKEGQGGNGSGALSSSGMSGGHGSGVYGNASANASSASAPASIGVSKPVTVGAGASGTTTGSSAAYGSVSGTPPTVGSLGATSSHIGFPLGISTTQPSSGLVQQPVSKRSSMIESLRSPIVSAAGAVGSYLLPEMITDMWDPTRDFAYAKIPSSSKSLPNACCIHSASGPLQLCVVTADGMFYVYTVDMVSGGECVLVRQHSILDAEESV